MLPESYRCAAKVAEQLPDDPNEALAILAFLVRGVGLYANVDQIIDCAAATERAARLLQSNPAQPENPGSIRPSLRDTASQA